MSMYRILPEIINHILRGLLPRDMARYFGTGILLILSSVAVGCASPTSTPISINTEDSKASPQVVATAYTAILVGELFKSNECLQVKSSTSGTVYTLTWTPDIEVKIIDNEVTITTGIVRDQLETIILHIGDNVRFSGGETMELSEQLEPSVGEGCSVPYWVIGFEVSHE